jgi:pimeloyl-ACP methyl ester carboxylesterase
LIVAGSEDALISSTQAETMRRQIPHSRLLVVEHCGHIINLEQPDQLNQIVKSFVQDGLGTSPSRVS